jgi:hypothetical protein
VQLQLGKDKPSELAKPYLNTDLLNNNEEYITKSLHLMTPVGKLPKSVDDQAAKSDLLEDMQRNHYRSAFVHPELTLLKIVKDSVLGIWHNL